MKFESKFGIREIVLYKPHKRTQELNNYLLEVQTVAFNIEGAAEYLCRYPVTGALAWFGESQLEGDPDFDQEFGYEDLEK